MSPPPSPDRKERMKRILEESYPRVRKEDSEPLPKSVLAELQGGKESAPSAHEPGRSFWQRLASFLRGPQALGLGAAAVLVVVGLFAILPGREKGGGTGTGTGAGEPMRSPDSPTILPPLVVLHGLADEQRSALLSSEYFRPEQLIEVPAGRDLATFIEEKRRPQLIVVDGTTGAISVPFSDEEPPSSIEFAPDADLALVLLDLLGELAKETPK